MKNLRLEKKYLYQLENWKTFKYDIYENDILVGDATVIEPPEEVSDQTYLETLGIEAEYRNQGIGTQVIKMLKDNYWFLYFAAADENSARLYKRIAEPYDVNTPAVDQGYGVYYLS